MYLFFRFYSTTANNASQKLPGVESSTRSLSYPIWYAFKNPPSRRWSSLNKKLDVSGQTAVLTTRLGGEITMEMPGIHSLSVGEQVVDEKD
jgi:hypothetical protein